MSKITIKRGDTFALGVRLKDETGQPLILTVDKLKSQIRDSSDNLIADLVITINPSAEGLYTFTASDTSTWTPNTTLYLDVEMNIDGQIRSSQTVQIYVDKDITRG